MKANDKYYGWGPRGWDRLRTYKILKLFPKTNMVEYELTHTNSDKEYTVSYLTVSEEHFESLKLSTIDEMVGMFGDKFITLANLPLTSEEGHRVTIDLTNPDLEEYVEGSYITLNCSCGSSITRRTMDDKDKHFNEFLTNTDLHQTVYGEPKWIEFDKVTGKLHILRIKANEDILQVPESYYVYDFTNALEGKDYIVKEDGTVDKLFKYEVEAKII